jgi:Asp-tRNA(Asn)/Glu-tRNA(Gln) amidotransferase A subunit family amidase
LASTWGGSWGTSWGTSWDRAVVAPAPVTEVPGGSSKRKKKPRIIRYSDFESREQYEKELRKAVQSEVEVLATQLAETSISIEEDDFDEDDALLRILVVLH